MNAPTKEDETPISNTATKPPRKSWFFVPLSPDNESNVYDDSDTELPDLQVPMRVSDIRKNIQMNVLGEKLQRMAQMKAYKIQHELENMHLIMQALKLDHNIDISHTTIANRIWKEINERIVFYVNFICGE